MVKCFVLIFHTQWLLLLAVGDKGQWRLVGPWPSPGTNARSSLLEEKGRGECKDKPTYALRLMDSVDLLGHLSCALGSVLPPNWGRNKADLHPQEWALKMSTESTSAKSREQVWHRVLRWPKRQTSSFFLEGKIHKWPFISRGCDGQKVNQKDCFGRAGLCKFLPLSYVSLQCILLKE